MIQTAARLVMESPVLRGKYSLPRIHPEYTHAVFGEKLKTVFNVFLISEGCVIKSAPSLLHALAPGPKLIKAHPAEKSTVSIHKPCCSCFIEELQQNCNC